jgi:hypothetical protein
VYDYTAGKSDWMAAGLPTEGEAAGRPMAMPGAATSSDARKGSGPNWSAIAPGDVTK